VTHEPDDTWRQIRSELAAGVDSSTFRIWLEPLRPVELDSRRVVLLAPPRTCGWISDRFSRVLQTAAAAVLGPEVTVELRPDEPFPHGAPSPPAPSPAPPDLPLHPKLTFDQFIIGDSNRLAHGAALGVAEMPGGAFNPLFLCGPPGLGKTHLLHSIGHYVRAHSPGMRLLYTTGEAFTNEFLAALRERGSARFKARFRTVDILLLDDVQFLERKTRTEEEFFHTFNALYESGAQIVLTSDRPPRDLAALEDRLRERFQSGLVADLDAPDLPTRLTILRKRAAHDGLTHAEPDALELIAHRVTDNVRALEGALIRSVAYASLTGRPLDAALAEDVLAGLYPQPPRRTPSVAEIKAAACEAFGLTEADLLSSSRTQRVSWPRQVAMFLARELTQESLPAIGRSFGGRDHTTVLHACRRTTARIAVDPRAHQIVADLRARLDGEQS
jgi:chromosomal replication initiator protein